MIRVLPRKEEIGETSLAGAVVAVIDALRATSTIATALAHGARAVIPCASPGEARRVAAAAPGRLLAGEEGALPIPGFDLGNSPREYSPEAVAGREIALVTTNGTRAIRLVQDGMGGRLGNVLLASFLNAGAAARALAEAAAGRDVVIVCSGTAGRFSLDDFLCAGALADALEASGAEGLDDLAQAARDAYRQNRGRLAEALAGCRHARFLFDAGLGGDVAFCARENVFDVVPVVRWPEDGGGPPYVTASPGSRWIAAG